MEPERKIIAVQDLSRRRKFFVPGPEQKLHPITVDQLKLIRCVCRRKLYNSRNFLHSPVKHIQFITEAIGQALDAASCKRLQIKFSVRGNFPECDKFPAVFYILPFQQITQDKRLGRKMMQLLTP